MGGFEGGEIVKDEIAGNCESFPIPVSGQFPGAGLEFGVGQIELDGFGGGVELCLDWYGNGAVGCGSVVGHELPILDARGELPVFYFERNSGFEADGQMGRGFQADGRRGGIGKTHGPKESKFGA